MSNRRFANKRFSQLNGKRCWHVCDRSSSKCCNLPVSEALYFVGKSAKRAVKSGWRAPTVVPTSLVIQLRKPPVRTLPVRHSLTYDTTNASKNGSEKVLGKGSQNPKDPAVLKILRDSELLRRSVFTTPPIFTTL